MTGTDLIQRTKDVVATIDGPDFQERVEALLPDTVPYRRFVQVAKTAVRATPDLVKADQGSLFGSIIRCAQDGLMPDGREAALVAYGDKVSYLPMIGGLRKRLAEYGWTLKTRVVYANDEFDYSEEPQVIRHVPVRPGVERGDRIAAYAVATHRDGRRLQIVLYADEIEKRKAKASSKNVWNEWPDAMWEKSAGHAIFDEIPQAERDRMTLPSDNGADAVDLLYGPNDETFTATSLPSGTDAVAPPQERAEPTVAHAEQASGTGDDGQQVEPPAPLSGGSTPDEPIVEAEYEDVNDPDEPQPAWVAAGETVVPKGAWKGQTLAQLSDQPEGRQWLLYALQSPDKFAADFYSSLTVYVAGALPDLTEETAA